MSTTTKGKKRYFVKIYPELCGYYCLLSLRARYVLTAFITMMSEEFKSGDHLRMEHAEAVYYLSHVLPQEALRSFTSSRFSEGIKELIEHGILRRSNFSKKVFRINSSLFNMKTVDKEKESE